MQACGLSCQHGLAAPVVTPEVQPLPVRFVVLGPKCARPQVAAVKSVEQQEDGMKKAMDQLARSGKFLEIDLRLEAFWGGSIFTNDGTTHTARDLP